MTAGAMHVQRTTAEKVIAAGSNYVLVLNGYRGSFRRCIDGPQCAKNVAISKEVIEKGHGRIEVRKARDCRDHVTRRHVLST